MTKDNTTLTKVGTTGTKMLVSEMDRRAKEQKNPEPITDTSYKATVEVTQITQLLEKHQLAKLLQIQKTPGRFYIPWEKDTHEAVLKPSDRLIQTQATCPSFNAVDQQAYRHHMAYLEIKRQYREDDDWGARPYKSYLANVCYKCIELTENMHDKADQKKYYHRLQLFLADVEKAKPALVDRRRRSDVTRWHVEHYLNRIKRIVRRRLNHLKKMSATSDLVNWINTCDEQLAALHIFGIQQLHYAVQGRSVPLHTIDELSNLSRTYHRLMQPDSKHQGKYQIKIRRSLYWQGIQQQAQAKYKEKQLDPTASLIQRTEWVAQGQLTLEEALFVEPMGANFTADQCLYLALYMPRELGISATRLDAQFGHRAVLDLYKTKPTWMGWRWLQWHMQQASHWLSPTLDFLTTQPRTHQEYTAKKALLVEHMQELAQAERFVPPITQIGVLTTLADSADMQPQLVQAYQATLTQCQYHLHNLGLSRLLLARYRRLIPYIGEMVGRKALRVPLEQLKAGTQKTLEQLLPLYDQLKIQYNALLEATDDSTAAPVVAWRHHELQRDRLLTGLKQLHHTCYKQLNALSALMSAEQIEQLAANVQRDLDLSDAIFNTGFSAGVSSHDAKAYEQGKRQIERLVSYALGERVLEPSPSPVSSAPATPPPSPTGSVTASSTALPESQESEVITPETTEIKEPASPVARRLIYPAAPSMPVRPMTPPPVQTPQRMTSTLSYYNLRSYEKNKALHDTVERLVAPVWEPLQNHQFDAVLRHWNAPLEEKALDQFYEAITPLARNRHSARSLALYLQVWQSANNSQHPGVWFRPLPKRVNCRNGFSRWWYKHDRAYSELGYRVIRLTQLRDYVAHSALTTEQYTCFVQVLQQEQATIQLLHDRSSTMWDWLRSGLKARCNNWIECLTAWTQEAKQWVENSKQLPPHRPDNPVTIHIQSTPTPVVAPTAVDTSVPTQPPVVLPTTEAELATQLLNQRSASSQAIAPQQNTPASAQQSTTQDVNLWDISPANADWENTLQRLQTLSPEAIKPICCAFFAAAQTRLQAQQLSFETQPEELKRCQDAVRAFHTVFQQQDSFKLLRSCLYNLHDIFENPGDSVRVKQRFFQDVTDSIGSSTSVGSSAVAYQPQPSI